jgi:hypothetical protein
MKHTLFVIALILLSPAHAEVTVETDKMKISDDCVSVKSDGVSIKSGDCSHRKKNKGSQENRSIHGDNNPGKGHDKQNQSNKKKD